MAYLLDQNANKVIVGMLTGLIVVIYNFRVGSYNKLKNQKVLKIICDFIAPIIISFLFPLIFESKYNHALIFVAGFSWVGTLNFIRQHSKEFILESIKILINSNDIQNKSKDNVVNNSNEVKIRQKEGIK